MPRPEPLAGLLGLKSQALAARVWRGYVAHSLFFYRQNDIRRFRDLRTLGAVVPFGPGCEPFPAAVQARAPAGASPAWRTALRAMRCKEAGPADRLLTRAIAAEPENASFYVLRGLCRYERYWGSLRLSPAALADFETAVRLDGASAWAHLLAGMALEMQRRYTAAIRHFDAAAALAPRWMWPHILRGICRWYQAEFEGCVDDFKRALELDPSSVPALLFLSRAKSDLRDRSLVRDLDRALRLAPRSGLVLCWRGRAQFVVQRTPQSLKDLRRSTRLLPLYDRGYSWLGISLMELGRRREALRPLQKADRLNPFYPTTIYPLAQALMDAGRWTEAGGALRRAAAIDRCGIWVEHRISMIHPNPACLRSIRDLDRFLQVRPRAAWALAWRGQTRLLLRQYRAALSDLGRAEVLAPRDPWARLWRGEALRRMGYLSQALEAYNAALALDASLSWAWAAAGGCLLGLGEASKALEALDRSLALQPQCAPALAWRGEALAALGRGGAGDRAAARELRSQYGAIEGPPQTHAEASFSPHVLAAYCRENESEECLRAFEAKDFDAALRAAAPPARPGQVRSFLFRGWLRLACADPAGAVEEASAALDEGLDPRCAPALLLRSRAKRALGQTAAALEDERRLALLAGAPETAR